MSATERMQKLLAANPKTLARVDAILDGTDTTPTPVDQENRLVTLTEAGRRLNLSRPTVRRLARAGRLESVALNGVNRITLRSVNAMIDAAK